MTRLARACASSPCVHESVHVPPHVKDLEKRAMLRHAMRARRRAIAGRQRHELARRWAVQAAPLLVRRGRLALYMASSEELDVGEFLERALARRRTIYLPVIERCRRVLAFRRMGGDWIRNRYGIKEPGRQEPLCKPCFLSVVVVPLVAFDAQGCRIGMGGGYYDRTMAFRRLRRVWKRPLLIGAAYACQQATRIHALAWDVPLDAVITERGWLVIQRTAGFCAGSHEMGDSHGA